MLPSCLPVIGLLEMNSRTRSIGTPFGDLVLREIASGGSDRSFELRIAGRFLVGTQSGASERSLATCGIDRWTVQDREPRVLIGGLGFGYTVREVLRQRPSAEIVVVELFPEVEGWCDQVTGNLVSSSDFHASVLVKISDFWDYLALETSRLAFDILLVDVDNGPANLALPENAKFYTHEAILRYYSALRCGGVLAIWSSHSHEPLRSIISSTFGQNRTFGVPVRSMDSFEISPDFIYGGVRGDG